MSSKKTISINPNLFNVGGKKGKSKTLKRSKPKPNKSLIKPKMLKKRQYLKLQKNLSLKDQLNLRLLFASLE